MEICWRQLLTSCDTYQICWQQWWHGEFNDGLKG